VPEVPQSDVDFLLRVASTVLEVGPSDVLGSFAGLRPLLASTGARGADLSRKHAVLTSPDGVLTVVGGKLTTYRRMAADAVTAAVELRGLTAGPCRTADLPLVGAGNITPGLPSRLVARYGAEAAEVAALNMPEQISGEITAAEIVWAIRHEGALDAADVLERRTRISLVPTDRTAAEPLVQALLSGHR
jgi:glycerol-3-phosphate dehydrogenase